MYVCMYVCMCVCMHVCVRMYTCVCACMYVYMYAHMHACMYVYMSVRLSVYVRVYVCMHVRTYVRMYDQCIHVCTYAQNREPGKSPRLQTPAGCPHAAAPASHSRPMAIGRCVACTRCRSGPSRGRWSWPNAPPGAAHRADCSFLSTRLMPSERTMWH